jgi:hypothetical protein
VGPKLARISYHPEFTNVHVSSSVLTQTLKPALVETMIPFCRKSAKGAPGLALETWDPRNEYLMDTLDGTTG